jgi:hypothetical protein
MLDWPKCKSVLYGKEKNSVLLEIEYQSSNLCSLITALTEQYFNPLPWGYLNPGVSATAGAVLTRMLILA